MSHVWKMDQTLEQRVVYWEKMYKSRTAGHVLEYGVRIQNSSHALEYRVRIQKRGQCTGRRGQTPEQRAMYWKKGSESRTEGNVLEEGIRIENRGQCTGRVEQESRIAGHVP